MNDKSTAQTIDPKHITQFDPTCDISIGEQAIHEHKVHTIILAGGVGSRLGFSKPKALLPIGPNTTLLSHFLSHTGDNLDITFLCSDMSVEPITQALPKGYLAPIVQDNLPYKGANHISAPNGNGGLLGALKKSNRLQELKEQGVTTVLIQNVDNPLLLPYDPHLITTHLNEGCELSFSSYLVDDKSDRVGVFAQNRNILSILDYTQGSQPFSTRYANINHMCISISLLDALVNSDPLPIHWVKKTTLKDGKEIEVLKGEKFITDICPFASSWHILLREKSAIYAPLKTPSDLSKLSL